MQGLHLLQVHSFISSLFSALSSSHSQRKDRICILNVFTNPATSTRLQRRSEAKNGFVRFLKSIYIPL
ncbi:hypothetical protein P8452_00870 [Trifolium repens]|nr:hypothetical protein P8452_00870 [Trifolium repens]